MAITAITLLEFDYIIYRTEWSPKRYVALLGPMNVSLFTERVFVDIIKLRILKKKKKN